MFRKLVKLNIIRFEILYERDIVIYLPIKRILIPVQKQFKTELIASFLLDTLTQYNRWLQA